MGIYILQEIDQSKKTRRAIRVNVLVYEVETTRAMRAALLEASQPYSQYAVITMYAYAHPDDIAKAAWLARLTIEDGKPGRLNADNNPELMRVIADLA